MLILLGFLSVELLPRDTSPIDKFAGYWKVKVDAKLAGPLPGIEMESSSSSTLNWWLEGQPGVTDSITWDGHKTFTMTKRGTGPILEKVSDGTYDGVSSIKWNDKVFGMDGVEFVYLGKSQFHFLFPLNDGRYFARYHVIGHC